MYKANFKLPFVGFSRKPILLVYQSRLSSLRGSAPDAGGLSNRLLSDETKQFFKILLGPVRGLLAS